MSTPATDRHRFLGALRAAMILLGLVRHSPINYLSTPASIWPQQDPAHHLGFADLVIGIHVFRMPVFFVVAGFFPALSASRGVRALIRSRLEPVSLPFVVTWLVLPPFVMFVGWLSLILNTGDTEATLASPGRDETSSGLRHRDAGIEGQGGEPGELRGRLVVAQPRPRLNPQGEGTGLYSEDVVGAAGHARDRRLADAPMFERLPRLLHGPRRSRSRRSTPRSGSRRERRERFSAWTKPA
jgi:hypothetical protein